MKDERSIFGVAFLLAAVIVCGASFVIASKGGDIISGTPTTRAAGPASSPQPAPAPVAAAAAPLLVRVAPPPAPHVEPSDPPPQAIGGSGIYRCSHAGSVVYSNQPCRNGREVDVRATRGFDPIHTAPAEQRPRTITVVREAREEAVAPSSETFSAAANEANDAKLRAARCAVIDAEIARIDALAREGGSASYQDRLRERRQQLVDEKYNLKC